MADEEGKLLADVVRRSLTTTETYSRRLRWENVKAPQLGIKQPEHVTKEKAAAMAAKAARLAKQQHHADQRMADFIDS